MPISSNNQGSIGTTPVQLSLNGDTVGTRVTIIRQGGSAAYYYLGSGSSVSPSSGLKVTEPLFTVYMAAGDSLYAVTDSGTVILHTDEEY